MSVRSLGRRLFRSLGLDVAPIGSRPTAPERVARILAAREIGVVLDVGANRGQYALGLREAGYEGRIVSFEPLSGPHARLCERAARDPRWTAAARMALGAEPGTAEINVASNLVSSSFLPGTDLLREADPEAAYVAKESVRVSTLDLEVRGHAREGEKVFLKLDTQGFEREVLAGGAGVLGSIEGIQLEMSLKALYVGQPLLEDWLGLMKERGYELGLLLPAFTDRRSGEMLQCDGVFLRPR